MSKLSSRVGELEKRSGGAPVYAVRYHDEELCRVVHTGELLTVEEFELRYPMEPVIIHVVYKDMAPVEPEKLLDNF